MIRPSIALADRYQICGLSYNSDDFEILSSDSVKVNITSNSRLISLKEFELLVLKEIFGAQVRPPLEDFSSCLLILQQSKKEALSKDFIKYIIDNRKLDDLELLKLLRGLNSLKSFSPLSRQLLKEVDFDKYSGTELFLTSEEFLKNPEWLKNQLPKVFYKYAHNLKTAFKSIIIKEILDLDFDKLHVDMGRFSSFFSIYKEEDSSLYSLYEQLNLLSYTKERTYDFYYEYYKNIYEYLSKLSPAPDPDITEKYIQNINSIIKDANEKKNFEGALSFIKFIKPEWRTPETHSLVFDILDKSPQSIFIITKDEELSAFYGVVAKNDASLQESIVNLVNKAFVLALEKGDIDTALNLINFLNRAAVENVKTFYKDLGFYYLSQGDQAKARYYLQDKAEAEFSFKDKLKLMFKGYYFSVSLIYLMALALIAILVITLGGFKKIGELISSGKSYIKTVFSNYKTTPYGTGLRQKSQTSTGSGSGINKEGRRTFVTNVQEEKSAERREYEELLAVFGLEVSATEKDIKNAYRMAVKRVHPDLKRKQSRAHSGEFVQLTRDYEKLVRLRKDFG